VRPKHARQRRAPAHARGWYTVREYAEAVGVPYSTVARWCSVHRAVPDATGAMGPVEGGGGHDYRIPLSAV